MRERHRYIERRRSGMIAHADADPAYTSDLRFFDGEFGSAAHDQMAHAIVAVDKRCRGAIVEDTDVRLDIDAAGTQPADVERQPDHAVSITAAQIGLHHQASDGLRVRLRQASGNECARYKIDELCGGNPPFWSRHFLYCCVLIHFQSLLKLIRGK
jgi:hypothetical protein